MPRPGEVVAVLSFGDIDAAGAAADDDAKTGIADLEPGIVECFAGGEHGNPRHLRVAARIGSAVEAVAVRSSRPGVFESVDRDGRRNPAGEIRRVEVGDPAGAADARDEVGPECFPAGAER